MALRPDQIPPQNTAANELRVESPADGELKDIFGDDASLVARISVVRADQMRRNGVEPGEAYLRGVEDTKANVALLLGDLLKFDPDLELQNLL